MTKLQLSSGFHNKTEPTVAKSYTLGQDGNMIYFKTRQDGFVKSEACRAEFMNTVQVQSSFQPDVHEVEL